ncbi:2-C-methyl-D-erythritol 4-phosphate cytidylyltransferase [Candidatus Magnetominusculus dajiuhuensis]|uniref:2-C-methyl-D-erythritol 4-phosphate cytidylyltransferase n=1 Tax=Candidatus Magnetominusculus dajiuhuensis TaxID=3137712 RepID=UPI003B43648C
MFTTAIVPAAGAGSRFGSVTNKVFHPVGGRPVLIRVLEILDTSWSIDEVIVVFKDSDKAAGTALIKKYGISKAKKIARGGLTRQESVFNALKLVDNKDSVVLIHDAARPFLSQELIISSLESLDGCEGVVSAVPLKDTIKEVRDGFAVKTLDRALLAAVATPQVFHYGTIFDAYKRAAADGLNFTDDTSAVEHYGGRIRIIPGDYNNIKITTPEDIVFADYLLSATVKRRR